MSTNNNYNISKNKSAKIVDYSKKLFTNNLLDVSILESMANEYFPELNQPVNPIENSDIYSTGKSLSRGILSENDFLEALNHISEVDSLENDISKNTLAGEQNSFSYVNDVNSIFIKDVKGNHANYFDINSVRNDFPILSEKVNGKNLVWFDNAATTQKPQDVINRLSYYYRHENSNVHRAAHELAARTTEAYESSRNIISNFINSPSPNEIVFVRGTTEAINLVAQTYGKYNLSKDDEIIISWLEHHANIVPWQMICAETGAILKVIPVDKTGQIILSEYQKLLSPRTKLVSISHVSNTLGTITPISEIIELAHKYGAKVLIDGAQAVSHLAVDVTSLDCDFYVFSGHKIFGPTGIGILYAKPEILNSMSPYQGGGNMIEDVSFERTIYKNPPHKFEAGTGSIADAIGLGTAIEYVTNLGIENIYKYEHDLLEYGINSLSQIPGLTLVGTAFEKTSVLSFVIDGFSTEEISKVLSSEGIAARAGHHCAQPILRRFGYESTVRTSLAFYNTYEEIDFLTSVLLGMVKK